VLTREAPDVTFITRGRLHADQVRQRLPWLAGLYHGPLLNRINQSREEPAVTAEDQRYTVVLNVQRGRSMRFEAHVDSNPLSGLLFFTGHPQGGGEICFARDPRVFGLKEIDRDCTMISPQPGHLVLFDGRVHPHYARRLNDNSDIRVLAAMNYYTASFPESNRPPALNQHLYGDPALSM